MKFKGVCYADCWDACAINFEIKNDLILKPDTSNPYTKNFLCQRIYKFLKDRESKKRITHPLIRKNGELRKSSWEETLNVISDKLQELKDKGKENSVLLGVNTGNTGIFMRLCSIRFFHLYGNITYMDGNLCDDAGNFAHELDFGACFNHPPEDILKSKTAIIWGRNPARTNIHFVPFIEKARKNGTFIYLIDPIKTETANFVNKHISVKPGSDVYLALAIAKVILENGWENKYFIENKTVNFEAYKNILNDWKLIELSEKCNVNLEDICEIAKRLSFEKPASIWLGMGVQHYSHGVSTFRAIDALSAITGNIGVKGGGVSFSHYSLTSFDMRWIKPINKETFTIKDFKKVPKASLASELEKETFEVLWIQSFNLFNQTQNTGKLKEVASKIPLKVVIDFRWNETTQLADIVLPCATYLEKEDIRGSFWNHIIGYLPKIFEPKGEALDEWTIYKELSKRLGFEKEFGEVEKAIEIAFSKLYSFGITPSLLKEKGWIFSPIFPEIPFKDGIFLTEDRKFHFAEKLKLPDLKSMEEYPFTLITPKALTRTNSQRSIEGEPKPIICLINPIWKEKYPFEEAFLVSHNGKLKVKLHFNPKIRHDTLLIDQGDTGINDLCGEILAEDNRGAAFFETKVRIEKLTPSS
ncbi:MAG: molybdopterin-dependent oxidoreductase [Synergistetes bacterium]|nr:molybdopterin-dependent oxidoreductase [Synergistota bacterium]MCX8127330.1 molybdopterin-dependent oxidoreductase [Synergistota bacterium]MDW8192194.1 molybdopterin-dependent oxidoreductase [Synergistota bacterium]